MNWRTVEYDTIDSTNLEAERLLSGGEGAWLAVIARHQTGGRGRLGRNWWDLPGRSLLASFVFERIKGTEASRLVSVASVAAIRAGGGEGPLLKWPNDIVYGDRKAGGLLAESVSERGGEYTVVGLGINLNYSAEELQIRSRFPPTSLSIEEGKSWDASALLADILREIDVRLGVDEAAWLSEYRGMLAYVGRTVTVSIAGLTPDACNEDEQVRGVLEGVDESGLLLLKACGRTLSIATGDILATGLRSDTGNQR